MEYQVKVLDVIQRTPDVKSFRFEKREGLDYKAGQFFLLSIELEGSPMTKPFSFSSSPTEAGYIEFTKKITDSSFSKRLDSLKVGDSVKIDAPYGRFVLNESDKNIVFLSGGIGITPIRSMCKYAHDKKLNLDLILLYGNNRGKDIAFKDELDRICSEDNNFHVIYTLMTLECEEDEKQCIQGYIDEKLIREKVPEYPDKYFYICGPPAMVDSMATLLKEKLLVGDDRIRKENFKGY